MEWISVEERPDYSARKKGLPTMSIDQRLKRGVKVNQQTGCWEWQKTKRNGYGRLIVGSRTDGTRKSVSAHRLSYELFCGKIPDGMEICHKCDNPCCINPDHLFAGSKQDNMDDRERKGRNRPQCGSDNVFAKLSEEAVLQARTERAEKGTAFETLAKRYGVAKKTMQNAINGITWKSVPLPPPPEL